MKGEVSVSMIITVIILVIGLGVLLFAFANLGFNENVDREVCHQSVIFRATTPGIVENFVSLRCKEGKICLTGKVFGKGECDEFKGEGKATTIRVNNLNDIHKVYADEILNCWTMMGEGKVSLFTDFLAETYSIGTVYPSCVICSRIAMDEESLKSIRLEDMDLFNYMQRNKVPGRDESYYEFLSGEGPAKISVKDSFIVSVPGEEENSKEEVSIELEEGVEKTSNLELLTRETAVMFMQINSPEHGKVVRNTLATIGIPAVGSLTIAPIATKSFIKDVASRVGVKGGVWGVIVTAFAGVVQQGSVAYNRGIAAGYCDDAMTGGEERGGCSVVRTVAYDAAAIGEYCQNIESIP
jgi:hypothetical protein